MSVIYIAVTDGSCVRNPGGPGGYAYTIFKLKSLKDFSTDSEPVITKMGSAKRTTSCRMELKAIQGALYDIINIYKPDINDTHIVVYSDSKYSIDVLAGYKNAHANLDIILPLKECIEPYRIQFKYVPAHREANTPQTYFNNKMDALAKEASKKYS